MKYSFDMTDVGLTYLNWIRTLGKDRGHFSIEEDSSIKYIIIIVGEWRFGIPTFDCDQLMRAHAYFLSRKMTEEKW